MTDTKRQEKAVATARQYDQGNIAGLDDAMTRRLIASTVLTESNGGDLTVTNRQGYVGRYQAGAGWLADAGLVNQGKLSKAMSGHKSEWAWAESGGMTKFLQDPANWNGGLSLEQYKQSAVLQDRAFKSNSDASYARAVKEGVLHEGDDPERIAGFLKARHISGYGGAKGVIQGRRPRSDANGTSNYDYYNDIATNRDGLDQLISREPERRLSIPELDAERRSAAVGHVQVNDLIKQGASGHEVRQLQASLARLGYHDARGHALKTDGDFGARTKEAVQAFQREHGLDVDGIAGSNTLEALERADRKLLTHPQHKHHGLYTQVLEKVHAAEEQRGLKPGQHSDKLAGALTVELIREGITRIDRIELNERGTLARAVQVHPLRDEPGLNRTTDSISTQQAMQQPLRESSEQAQQVSENVRLQQEEQQRVQARSALSM